MRQIYKKQYKSPSKRGWKSYLVPVGTTIATAGLAYAGYRNRETIKALWFDKPASLYTKYREPTFNFDYYSSNSSSSTSSEYDSADPYINDELVDLLKGFKFN